MNCLDLTLPTPAENIACDEALLDLCENSLAEPVLRFWESPSLFVVLGYANSLAAEIHFDRCQTDHIPVLRRCSGGGTVLQGPGCLNYSLILPVDFDPALQSITHTNRFIMEQHRAALAPLFLHYPVRVQGHTDLTLGELKFSGNAQRRRKQFVLFHGTFLLEFDLGQIERYLRFPSKAPSYRQNRPHELFLTNLCLPAARVKDTLRQAWQANHSISDWPRQQTAQLLQTKYLLDEWNLKLK